MEEMRCWFFADTQPPSRRYALHVISKHAVGSFGSPALGPWMGVCIHQQIELRVGKPELYVQPPARPKGLDGIFCNNRGALLRHVNAETIVRYGVQQARFVVKKSIKNRRLHARSFGHRAGRECVAAALGEQNHRRLEDALTMIG